MALNAALGPVAIPSAEADMLSVPTARMVVLGWFPPVSDLSAARTKYRSDEPSLETGDNAKSCV